MPLLSYCCRTWALRITTWSVSDLNPYLTVNQIRESLQLEPNLVKFILYKKLQEGCYQVHLNVF